MADSPAAHFACYALCLLCLPGVVADNIIMLVRLAKPVTEWLQAYCTALQMRYLVLALTASCTVA
jgi:hypothetical protein